MNTEQFIAHLRDLDVRLRADGQQLRLSAPRGAISDELRAEIAVRKPEILAWFAQVLDGSPEEPPIVPTSRDSELVLSFAQQRLWFLDQLAPDALSYLLPRALRIKGVLDVAALQRALQEVVSRHEALRTTFESRGDGAIQIVHPPGEIPLPMIDLAEVPAGRREAEARRLAAADAGQSFDLQQGPLFRCRLLRLEDQDHILLQTVHHIVSDGWSISIVDREVAALYGAFCANQPSPLPEPRLQYADFSAWQRNWLSGQVLDSQIAYWKENLRGLPQLELQTDHSRPSLQTFAGGWESLPLPQELVSRLRSLSEQEGSTSFMTLLAAFNLLLHHYTRQTDIVVGTPIAGRNRAEVENLVGLFVNMLVLRSDLAGDPTFRQLLSRVRQTAVGAFAHQDLPFEKLVEELAPQRDLSRTPLFQVAFAVQNTPTAQGPAAGVDVNPFPIDSQTARFDLEVHVWETAQGLSVIGMYNTDLFDASTIQRLLRCYQRLLEAVLEDPDQPLSRYTLATPSEQRQLLLEWNRPTSAYPRDIPVHVLFEQQAERTPDAVAIEAGDRQWSYRFLNQRSNRLARHLQDLGIRRDDIVGIYLERSPEIVAAMLGVLKSGAAYLPLDLDFPLSRLEFLLHDAHAKLLLTETSLQQRAPSSTARLLSLDKDWIALDAHDPANLNCTVTTDQLAYVIYTSGSTGTPKGVAVPQGAINRLVCNTDYIQLGSHDRVAQASTCSFDAATFEIWGALLNGAQLVMLPREVALSPSMFATALRELNVTTLFITTALFNQVARDTPAAFLTLKQVLFGGEKVDPTCVRAVLDGGPPQRLLHVYGPTESTTFATWHHVQEVHTHDRTVPIGQPVANTQHYILDDGLRPVPAGIPGELYLGGDGLARGYLGETPLTAARFVPHPFSPQPGSRLYRTGDIVRQGVDGPIEFLGRRDGQVKLRGFRIELGEIEATLNGHPAIREAVVVVRQDRPGDMLLVAYLVPQAEAELPWGEIREFLRQRLPAYMVPSQFVPLAAVPLTTNGKVDRRSLPAPRRDRQLQQPYAAPRNELEQQLVEIWQDVLSLETVGIQDEFFDLGGHSLIATRVVAHVRERLQVELPIRVLFERTTVAELAEQIEMSRSEPSCHSSPIPALVHRDAIPLSLFQERQFYLSQLNPHSAADNMLSPVHIQGRVDVAAMENSFQELIRRQASLRTSFSVVNGQPQQVIADTLPWSLDVIDLCGLPDRPRHAELHRRVQAEVLQPFDLERLPLWRASLLRFGESEFLLLFSIHHIVSDGWSLGVLGRELSQLYDAHCNGRPSSLPTLPIQYADYAVWQRQWLSGENLSNLIDYWTKKLAGAPVLRLPFDHPRPAEQTFRGLVEPIELTPAQSQAVKSLSQAQNATAFMTLIAAFDALVYHYTGQEDITVGTFLANRNRAETEHLVGFFINNLALRCDLSGNPTFRQVLDRVRDVTLEAYAHQDLPFEELLRTLQPARDPGMTPLFQVMFVFQNFPATPLNLSGTTTSSSGVPPSGQETRSNFDLTWWVWDAGDRFVGYVDFNADLFRPETIRRMLDHYRRLLDLIAADPDRAVGDLACLEAQERQELRRRARHMATSRSGRRDDDPDATSQNDGETAGQADLADRRATLAARQARLSTSQKALIQQRLRRKREAPDSE